MKNPSPRKDGTGRRHQQGPRQWPGSAVLRGVTMAPHWPGGKAWQAKLARRHNFTAAQARAANELSRYAR